MSLLGYDVRIDTGADSESSNRRSQVAESITTDPQQANTHMLQTVSAGGTAKSGDWKQQL
jgi:hypothetical protein